MKIVGFFLSVYTQLWQKQMGCSPSLGRQDWGYLFFALIFFFLLQFIFLFYGVRFCTDSLFCSPHFLTSKTSLLYNSFHKEIQAINSRGRSLQRHSTVCKENSWTKGVCKRKTAVREVCISHDHSLGNLVEIYHLTLKNYTKSTPVLPLWSFILH